MEIKKFDPKTDDLRSVADLILSAYSEGGENIAYDEQSRRLVEDLIETGGNFLGHESIYLCMSKSEIAGLVIGYRGKSANRLKVVFDLLIKLRLTQILNYLLVSSEFFHSGYTPYLEEDDFYISVLVVDEKYRRQGIGAYLLKQGICLAKQSCCKNVVLDVDNDNEIAKSLYKKLGFTTRKDHQAQSSSASGETCTLEYRVI